MTITYSRLKEAGYLSTSTTAELSPSTKTILDKITVNNVNSAARTLNAYLVPSGGTASNANKIIDNVAIAGGEAYYCPELTGHVLENGMTLEMSASSASSLVIYISGREIT